MYLNTSLLGPSQTSRPGSWEAEIRLPSGVTLALAPGVPLSRVLELEQLFLYLCLHDGGLLNLPDVCTSLQMKRPTVGNFIGLLENTHLIYRLLPLGYGKQVLRARPKVYLADAAIAPSVLLRGKSLLKIPAPFACYWLGRSEFEAANPGEA